MKVIPTALPGCVVIEPAVFGDARGVFFETWNAERFAQHGLPTRFVQSNVSTSPAACCAACITSGRGRRASW
jgi:dTDP-4-dehydrorhamnose 3,5-epimerase and related enzymes